MFIMTKTFLPCHGNRSGFSIRIKVGDRNVEVKGLLVLQAWPSRGVWGRASPGNFWQNHTCSIFQLFIQHFVARLQNQIGPCSKVFKIISRNLIQKRTEDINIQKEKQNNLTTRFKTNTICKVLWPLSKESTRDTIHRHTWCAQSLQSIIGRFQTRSAFCKFSEGVESFTAKEEDDCLLTSFWMFQKQRSFDISLWKGTMSEEMSVIHRQYTEI